MKTYIYSLANPENNEIFYIGKSNNPNRRLIRHISTSKREHKNKNKSDAIIAILDKGLYPIVNILEEVEESEWEQKERYYIEKYKAIAHISNRNPGGEKHPDWTGKKHTEETKLKISLGNKGKKKVVHFRSGIRRKQTTPRWDKGLIGRNGYKVYQYSLSGEYINSFNSTSDAGIHTGISQSTIVRCCTGKIHRAKNFIFSYEFYECGIEPFKYIHEVDVDCYSGDGLFIKTYPSLVEAGKDVGVSKSNISAVLRGKQKTCGGYIWKYHVKNTQPNP